MVDAPADAIPTLMPVTDSSQAGHAPEEEALKDMPSRSSEAIGRAALKAVAWNGLQLWGYNAVGLGVFIVLGRILAPRVFGLAASAMVVILFLRVVVDAGFSRLLVQRVTIDRDLTDTAFWTACLTGLVFTAVTVAAAPLFARLFGQPQLTELIRALSLIFIFAALDSTPTALLQRDLQWRTLALRRLAATVGSAVAAVWLAVSGAGAWSLVGQQLVLEGLTVCVLWFVTPWRPSLHVSRPAFAELVGFGTRYSVLRVLWFLGANGDNFLIAVFLGPVALGFYVVAYRIFTVLNELLITTISNVAMPMFSRLQNDRDALTVAFDHAVTAASALALPAYAGLAVVADQLIPTVFGQRWSPSVPVLELLAVAGFAQAQLAFSSSYVIATGRIRKEVPWNLGVTAAQLGGFLVAVHFGINAVAGALAVVLIAAWPARLVLIRIWDGPRLGSYLKTLLPLAASTAVMASVVLALKSIVNASEAAKLTIEILAGAATYPFLLMLLAPRQLGLLRSTLRRGSGEDAVTNRE